jgi:hypothetical protein
MMSIEDFTELEEGTLVAGDGQICRCPRCGRNGLLLCRSDGLVRFVHVQASRMFGDGMTVEPEDCCTMPEMSVA